jgi:hypothetical protein
MNWLTGITLIIGAGQAQGYDVNDYLHSVSYSRFSMSAQVHMQILELETPHHKHVLEIGVSHYSTPFDGELHRRNQWELNFWGGRYRYEFEF